APCALPGAPAGRRWTGAGEMSTASRLGRDRAGKRESVPGTEVCATWKLLLGKRRTGHRDAPRWGRCQTWWGRCQTLFLVLTCCLRNQKQSLTLDEYPLLSEARISSSGELL